MGIVIPKQLIKAERKSPQELIIFGKPKSGKTTILSLLPNCLILDLEGGSNFVDALKIKANTIKEIKEIGEEIIKANKPYEYIAVDTITALEEMIMPLAVKLYTDTAMGKNFDGDDVRKLPQGAGYLYIRQAFFQVVDYIRTLAPNIILVGHTKEKSIDKKGKELLSRELDLTGKLSSLASAHSDAISYLYRDGAQTILSFKGSDETICGSRCDHLRGRDIVIAEEIDDKLESYWDRVYINLKQ
jgi:hypothetical protein